MDEKDFTRIRVGQFEIGITGLQKLVKELSGTLGTKNDAEIGAFMVRELSAHNYIPDGARDEYAKAFVRELRKAIGQEMGGTHPQSLDIKVLGMGCAQCDSLEQMVMGLLTELNLPASLDHITDIKAIAQYGVMGVPALVINGKVVAVGKVPPRHQIKTWLVEAGQAVAAMEGM